MCGIAGICHLDGGQAPLALVKRMTDIIAHRGPDGEGYFSDGPVALGHRRLAILDLSTAGTQPMKNETGDVVVVYNGEVYNFQSLRVELETLGHQFHSRTDSEVVVHAYEQWGERCVEHFNGMFAFAIWDRQRQRLFLARDRYGIKPLYWYCQNGLMLFASEIKAILRHPEVSPRICYEALNEYFTFQNIFTDLTLFDGIHLLSPGCTLSVDVHSSAPPAIQCYWDYSFPVDRDALSLVESEEQLYHLFVQAVNRQLVSDVPIGAYLSGGMDSGSITAVARQHLGRLMTFTCGFDLSSASGLEIAFDERARSEQLSNLLKTEHYEMVLHAGDMEHIMPELIWHLEDLRVGQCYPNYYVARLAGKFVKVVLSGAGGDELFAGYPWRYYHTLNSADEHDYYRNYYDFWQRLVPDEDKERLFHPAVYHELKGHSTFDVFRNVFHPRGLPKFESNEDYVNASLLFELKTFLHGLLVVEDKVSMAHGLETRVPFLDNDLVDFAQQVPVRYKLRDISGTKRIDENVQGKRLLYALQSNDGKTILRNAMRRIIPQEITERNKQGFSAPDASWFRGDSIDYINRLLRNSKAMIYELVRPEYVSGVLDEHCSGKVNRRLLIWSFLSVEWLLRRFMNGSS